MNIKDGSNKPYLDFSVDAQIHSIAHEMARSNMTAEDLANRSLEYPSLANSYVSGRELYMWGWLGDTVPNREWDSKELKEKVINKLEGISPECRIEFCCGYHDCEVCNENTGINGSIYIRRNKKIYCCPNGVEHYIKAHDYCPPKAVVEAILNGEPLSGYDCTIKFIEKNKRKIDKQYRIERKKVLEKEEARKLRDIRMKRVEDSRTPEQKSVLSRLKKGILDLV